MRRLALLALLLGVAAGVTVVPASHTAQGAPAPPCGSGALARLAAAPPSRGDVPVLFVHGMGGSPAIWSEQELDGSSSLADRVSDISGTTVWAFDYSRKSLEWVTNANIGPALARSISCLADYTGKPVVIVDHSMGGLATQLAVAQRDSSSGKSVASQIAEVVAIATPFEGSKLLSVAQAAVRGGESLASDPGLTVAVEALLSACAGGGRLELAAGGGNPCGILAVLRSPVGSALMYHSAAIQRLPSWPSSLAVKAILGEIKITVGFWKLKHTFDLGDILVSQDSAGAHNTDGTPGRVICNENVLHALTSACYHGNLPRNPAVVDHVLAEVKRIVARERPAPKPATPPTPTTRAAPPPTTTQATPSAFQIGAPFDDECGIAWPTAPTTTSTYIEMTMTCLHVPPGEYQFTQVVYGDPHLDVTPSTGRMHVIGKVVDVAQSGYGFKVLVVQAERIELP